MLLHKIEGQKERLLFNYAITKRVIGTQCTLNQNSFNSTMALELTFHILQILDFLILTVLE